MTTAAGTNPTSPTIDESFSFAANRSMWLKRGKLDRYSLHDVILFYVR